jgi:16S rRNA A1518/A1519 N6-dimethyltransferase RsmA/KsgA/DIM1 with predicted DNA glycosylase/AP lyase activity
MNLKHHYLNDKSYVLELVKVINSIVDNSKSEKDKKILTVGCSVGRIPLELGKIFKNSIGIDYTTRYFQMSIRLKNDKNLKIKDIDIDLEKIGIDPTKI